MTTGIVRKITVSLAIALAAGCAVSQNDPLLYDDDGNQRAYVSQGEVDAAGVLSCSPWDEEFAEESDAVRVPVIGGQGEPVLLGVGGLALCVSDDGEEEGEDGGLEVDDVEGLDPHSALGASDDDDAEVGVQPGRHRNIDQAKSLMLDQNPTPEPAGE